MKKTISMVMAMLLLLSAFAALAEDATDGNGTSVETLIENGSLIIHIPVEDDLNWAAGDMAQDDSVVRLYSAEVVEDAFVARYDAVGDGDVTVSVRHFYNGDVCDEAYSWDLRVRDGAVQEVVGGSYTAAPDDMEMDPYLSGEWLESENQSVRLTVAKGEARGWDVEIVSQAEDDAYVFKATIYYDCELDSLVYSKGKFWNGPASDAGDGDLGEADAAGTMGSFTVDADGENITLTWYDDTRPEAEAVFVPQSDASDD